MPLPEINRRIEKLENVVFTGNGQPSLIAQLQRVEERLGAMIPLCKEAIDSIRDHEDSCRREKLALQTILTDLQVKEQQRASDETDDKSLSRDVKVNNYHGLWLVASALIAIVAQLIVQSITHLPVSVGP